MSARQRGVCYGYGSTEKANVTPTTTSHSASPPPAAPHAQPALVSACGGVRDEVTAHDVAEVGAAAAAATTRAERDCVDDGETTVVACKPAAVPQPGAGDDVLSLLLRSGDADMSADEYSDGDGEECIATSVSDALAPHKRTTPPVVRARYMRLVLAFVLLAMLIIGMTMDMSQERREVQQLFTTARL